MLCLFKYYFCKHIKNKFYLYVTSNLNNTLITDWNALIYLESGLAPQSQKKLPNFAYETSCPRWHTRAHTVHTPTPSTILHVWQWYQCWFINSRWVTVNVHSLYCSIASSSCAKYKGQLISRYSIGFFINFENIIPQ